MVRVSLWCLSRANARIAEPDRSTDQDSFRLKRRRGARPRAWRGQEKALMTLLVAGAALIGVQAVTAKPAEAFGWCGWHGRAACAKPARAYRAVRYYKPVRSYRRGCWW